MTSDITLDYQFSVQYPDEAQHARALCAMLERAPGSLEFECVRGAEQYHGQLKARAAGDLGLTELQIDSPAGSDTVFSVGRTRSHLARNPSFGFHLALWLAGGIAVNTKQGPQSAQPGAIFVMAPQTPYSAHIASRGHTIHLALPACWDRVGDTRMEDIFGTLYPSRDQPTHWLINYAQNLLRQPDSLAVPGAAQKLYEVIALALNPKTRSEHAAGMLALICRCIDVHCTNFTLSPDHVAALFGISVRHLHRLFAASKLGFTDYLVKQRLALAARLLGEPRYRQQTILRIALECGFRDVNHFGRRFREQHGMTPGEFRHQQVLTAPDADIQATAGGGNMRSYRKAELAISL